MCHLEEACSSAKKASIEKHEGSKRLFKPVRSSGGMRITSYTRVRDRKVYIYNSIEIYIVALYGRHLLVFLVHTMNVVQIKNSRLSSSFWFPGVENRTLSAIWIGY